MAVLHPVRAKLVQLMRATLADHQNWTYYEVRPLPVPPVWKQGMKVRADCSKGVQMLCRWAGAPDPMNMSYGPWGNSTTLAAHLPHLAGPAVLLLEVGDIVTFGPNGDQHATMVLEPGPDPLLWSHGHQGAPNTYRLSQDNRDYQCLKLILPKHVPTKAELLRAKTGYWSWLQWKLGEGDWNGYTPHDKTVRPAVGKFITVGWWTRYATFITNRQKPNPPTP